jgi:hypothetical protein
MRLVCCLQVWRFGWFIVECFNAYAQSNWPLESTNWIAAFYHQTLGYSEAYKSMHFVFESRFSHTLHIKY